MTTNLIQDCQHELNFRQRGREARLQRLIEAGIPTDRDGIRSWMNRAMDARLEADGGIYHACTVRVSSGCDPDLPQTNRIGCRITRVPIKAHYIPKGMEINGEDGYSTETVEEPYWSVYWGSVGTGWMAPVTIPTDGCTSAEQAEQIVRERLLKRDDCFRTRAEAVAAVEKMLAKRVTGKAAATAAE